MTKLFEPKDLKDESIDSLLEEPKEEIFPEEEVIGEKVFPLFPNIGLKVFEYYTGHMGWKCSHMRFFLETVSLKRHYELSINFSYDKWQLDFACIRASEDSHKRPKIFRERPLKEIVDDARTFTTSDGNKEIELIKSKQIYTWPGHQKPANSYNASIQFLPPLAIRDPAEIYANIKLNFGDMNNFRIISTEVCILNRMGELPYKGECKVNPFITPAHQEIIEVSYSKTKEYPHLELITKTLNPK